MVKRLAGSEKRLNDLIKVIKSQEIASREKVLQLRKECYEMTLDMKFKKAENMGEILEVALNFLRRNYKSHFNY